ncbi:hypothetical protein Ahy_B01g056377 [Arachis hypogaea]|uniref:Uncharacterized protein n=1 Tax=Arachis hypogaea TaxID=3818 RepID=A0A445AYT1_ARAHY|nr:hypothetical protein Ahy_B01g056377 [Arachis hypogaea]
MCSAVKPTMGVNGASVSPFVRISDTEMSYKNKFFSVMIRDVRRFGGPHSCLGPTISQDHRQLDSSLICRVILSLIQSHRRLSMQTEDRKF